MPRWEGVGDLSPQTWSVPPHRALTPLLCIVTVLCAPALAQDSPVPTTSGAVVVRAPFDVDPEYKTLEDHAFRALRESPPDWTKAADCFGRLADVRSDRLDYRLDYALALYESGKVEDSRQKYTQILESDPENILALLASARISARNAKAPGAKKDELLAQARDMLKHGARNGLNALRAVKTYPEFADLKTDVTFAIDIIRESRSNKYEGPPGKDPFYCPLQLTDRSVAVVTGGPKEDPLALTPAEQERLVKRLDQLFNELDPLIDKGDYDVVGRKWDEISEILRQKEKITSIDLRPRFSELMKRHQKSVILIRSMLLKYFYSEGDRLISSTEQPSLKSEYEKQDYRKVFDLWDKLKAHTDKMKATDPKFEPTAQDLLAKGRPFFENAQKLQELEGIKIEVVSIVLGGGVAQCIVNGRILGEGDMVYDLSGAPIADLRVVEIKKRRVKFQYKGLLFEPKGQLPRSY